VPRRQFLLLFRFFDPVFKHPQLIDGYHSRVAILTGDGFTGDAISARFAFLYPKLGRSGNWQKYEFCAAFAHLPQVFH
jgi:hypothetical protein